LHGQTDRVLIVGAGLAGLFLALKLAPRPALVLSPAPLGEAAASAWAQGGLAAALGPEDAPALHAADTVAAGAGLVDPAVALLIATEGPERVRDLLALGVPFDRSADGALSLSLEAAHSRPRVARVKGDLAGRAIMQALIAAVRAAPHVNVVEGLRMTGLLQTANGAVAGVACVDAHGARVDLTASETVLATGGVGGLFAVTTNPAAALGAGLAAAFTAGALVSDAEFVQFHPTAIDVGADPAPLATEALRGEGARLINGAGEGFMPAYHPSGDLAPRDVVARAIHAEIAAGRGAFLDARAAVGDHFPQAFPAVFAACMAAGLDPRSQPIPIAPAAHYHMGGVVSDLWGRSTLERLSVLGECASTGAHGANRLASNSLLEAVVFAARIGERLRDDPSGSVAADLHAAPAPDLPPNVLSELRQRMARTAGVMRSAEGLTASLAWIDDAAQTHGPAAALTAARLICAGALARQESRGGHYREDFPETAPDARRAFVSRAGDTHDAAA
jgi:L-aspartate oxidase